MTTYHLTWEIEIDAESPREAADQAARIQLAPHFRPAFTVAVEGGPTVTIDLEHPDHPDLPPAGAADLVRAIAERMADRPAPSEVAALARVMWAWNGVHAQVCDYWYGVTEYADYALNHQELITRCKAAHTLMFGHRPDADRVVELLHTPPVDAMYEGGLAPAARAVFDLGERVGERAGECDIPAEGADIAEQIVAVVHHMIEFASACAAWSDADTDDARALRAYATEAADDLRALADLVKDIPAVIRACPVPAPRWPYE